MSDVRGGMGMEGGTGSKWVRRMSTVERDGWMEP